MSKSQLENQMLEAGFVADVLKLFKDSAGNYRFAFSDDVPSNGTAGYKAGCVFIWTDATVGTTAVWVNTGTGDSSKFAVIKAT